MRKYRLPGFMVMICIVLLLSFADGTTEDASRETTDYELMSLLISDEYESEFSLILIGRDTEPWCLAGRLDILREEWPKLKNETIDALIINNRGETSRLDERFRLPVEYRLVSDREYLKALHGGTDRSDDETLPAGTEPAASGADVYAAISDSTEPDWDNFDRVYPDAQGYLTFSRVGFDSGRTQALVIFSNSYRCSGARMRPATRRLAFFMKKSGAWELAGVSGNIKAMN